MKYSRLETYRKRYSPFLITFKVTLIAYLLIFSISYLTTDTIAYYSSKSYVNNIPITAGTWEVEEELPEDSGLCEEAEFDGEVIEEDCEPNEEEKQMDQPDENLEKETDQDTPEQNKNKDTEQDANQEGDKKENAIENGDNQPGNTNPSGDTQDEGQAAKNNQPDNKEQGKTDSKKTENAVKREDAEKMDEN